MSKTLDERIEFILSNLGFVRTLGVIGDHNNPSVKIYIEPGAKFVAKISDTLSPPSLKIPHTLRKLNMTSLTMASYTEVQIPRPRKKARKSCLYCQKAHRICGNERPCGQCVKRKMPSQCVDGHRKPPKYLSGNTKRGGSASLHRDVTSQQPTQCEQGASLNITKYKNETTPQKDSDERQSRRYRQDTFDEVFDELIDSNFFYTEGSSLKFGNQASGRTIAKGNDDPIPFFSNSGYSAWSERSSSVSGDSEVESYQTPEDDVGDRLVKLRRYARDDSYFGFSISSGWSSTFFPHGIDENQHY